jgi:peptidoglycan/LPS O-acetylase OafA/YrhL
MLQSDTQQRSNLSYRTTAAHRSDIDGLRAVAVLAVVVNHLDAGLLPGGYLGVDIFFVISGYVITASLSNRAHAGLTSFFTSFYMRRMKRLLPALCFFILITSIVGSLFINPWSTEYKSSLRAGIYALIGSSNIYLYLKSIDYFAAPAELNLFTHTWSLGVEEQFYLIYPLLFWLSGFTGGKGRRRLIGALAAASILSFAAYVWLSRISPMQAYFMMPPRFWELGAGCLTHLATWRSSRGGIVPIAALAGLGLTLFQPQERGVYITPLTVLCTAVLIAQTNRGSLACNLLSARPLVWIGLISYSLYLWHWSLLVIARWTIGVHFWAAPILLTAIFAMATLSYYFIERPFRHMTWARLDLVTVMYGGIASGISVAAVFCILVPLRGALYLGERPSLIERGVATLLKEKYWQGTLIWPASRCIIASNDDAGKPIDPETCSFGDSNAGKRRFLVIGNSFSAAEFEMYSVLGERGLGTVEATSSWGAPPVPQRVFKSYLRKANAYYWDSVIPRLVDGLRRGDVLIMINDLEDLSVQDRGAPPDRLDPFKRALTGIARQMSAKGVQVIFQAGLPFIRDSGCGPDTAKPQWFNLSGLELCKYYSRTYSKQRLAPLNAILDDISKEYLNFHVLDLFDIYCPGEVCRLYNEDGIFLYRDGNSHPSVEANMLSRGVFLSVADKAIRNAGGK